MIQKILQRGNPLLAQKSKEVTDISAARHIIQNMRDTIAHQKTTHNFTRGIGLAAPQIGELFRIAIIESNGTEYILINPEFTYMSKETAEILEGCLSFFQYRGYVPRATSVTVKALDEHGKEFTVEATGEQAALFQHEIDHLNGILYVDRLPNGEKDLINKT